MFERFVTVVREGFCERCRGVNHPGETVVELTLAALPNRYVASPWMHPRCAVDVSPHFMMMLLVKGYQFEGRDSINALATQRALLSYEIRGRKTQGDLWTLCDGVAPALDPAGRRRVRVLVHNRTWAPELLGDGLTAKLTGVQETIRTTILTRYYEYILVGERSSWPGCDYQPYQPDVAAVMLCSSATDVRSNESINWVNAGLGPPVIWVTGETLSARQSEQITLSLRKTVDGLGYRGDECPTLCSGTVTNEALQELGVLLDEHVARDFWAQSESDAAERTTHLLECQVAHVNTRAMPTCFGRARSTLTVATNEQRQRLVVAATAAMNSRIVREQARAFAASTGTVVDPRPLVGELEAALKNLLVPLGLRFAVAANALVYSGNAMALGPLFEDTLARRNPPERSRRILRAILATCQAQS